jgi:hypothetical protein
MKKTTSSLQPASYTVQCMAEDFLLGEGKSHNKREASGRTMIIVCNIAHTDIKFKAIAAQVAIESGKLFEYARQKLPDHTYKYLISKFEPTKDSNDNVIFKVEIKDVIKSILLLY